MYIYVAASQVEAFLRISPFFKDLSVFAKKFVV